MKKKFLGCIGKITKKEFFNILKEVNEFKNLKKFKINRLNVGEMSNTYLLEGHKKYFVKEVKTHEAQINHFLFKLKLKHLPYTLFPELLKKGVLVLPYINKKMLRKRKINLSLLDDFIKFQNKMNNKEYFDKYNLFNLKNFSQKEEGFFTKNLLENFKESKTNLIYLKKYKLKVVDDFLKLLDYISNDKEKIINDFVTMPFARQHHDFREDNILIKNNEQFLIDWGSSYGYGPFMYDYSKFLINDKKALNLVIEKSKMCKNINKEIINRWLYVSLVAKMLNMLRWYIPKNHYNIETKEKTKKFLEYEYKTYKILLD